MSGMPHIAEHNFTKEQHERAAAVSETKPKKCNCMPACSHKFCGCPAHYWEPERPALTPRESMVASLYATGFSAKRVASMLSISPRTVEVHIRHVYEKLGAHSRDELIDIFSGESHEHQDL